ncbi:MAG: ABC-three component system middle component 2 [Pseudomonadota bacterium]
MDEMMAQGGLTFNGTLEAGIRAVAVLGAAFPRDFDIQRLTALDYLLVHTELLGGPADLHPEAPIKTPATDVRRRIVQDAVHLMMTRNLIERLPTDSGLRYRAGETAAMFLDALTSPYLKALKERSVWLAEHFAHYDDNAFDALMRRFFDQWVVEFQDVERSLGGQQ